MSTTPNQKKRLDADLLTHQEIESVLATCSKRAPTGIRNAALIAVLWRCGLRISEGLALHSKDIDLENGTLIVQCGKGGKRRVVGMDAGTAAIVERWMRVRSKRRIPSSAPLFCTLAGGTVDASYTRHLLPRLARRAGLQKRLHAHALRHSYAIDLIREGATITIARDLLGHSSVAVTDRYLTRIGSNEAVDFARARIWQTDGTAGTPSG